MEKESDYYSWNLQDALINSLLKSNLDWLQQLEHDVPPRSGPLGIQSLWILVIIWWSI